MARNLSAAARERLDGLANTTPGKELLDAICGDAEKVMESILVTEASKFEHLRGELRALVRTVQMITGRRVKFQITVENEK